MMISDMFLKMMIRETLTKTVRSLLRKQKQHRDLQRRGVREEPLAVRVAAACGMTVQRPPGLLATGQSR